MQWLQRFVAALASFTHLGHVCGSGSMLVVHPSTPFNSVADVVAASKRDPSKWSNGTSGVGGPHHLSDSAMTAILMYPCALWT